jgi:hypothetical protein
MYTQGPPSGGPTSNAVAHLETMTANAIVWLIVLALIVFALVSLGRSRGRTRHGPGPGAAGAIYDLLNQDKRNAIELIVEEKAEARDPETADDKPRT